MNKYSLIIEEKIEGVKDFYTKPIISIEGNSLTEILAKFPLELNRVHELHIEKISNGLRFTNVLDDDIPF